jgi:peptidoglycan hydrolase-like protein with peptidoglycan-binding domain
MRQTVLMLALLMAVAACTNRNAETRAREAEKKIKEAIPDVMGTALAQKISPEDLKKAQQELKVLSEYLGDATGKLDPVTVSAIQAFQREQSLRADGILSDKTMRLLQEAATKAAQTKPAGS